MLGKVFVQQFPEELNPRSSSGSPICLFVTIYAAMYFSFEPSARFVSEGAIALRAPKIRTHLSVDVLLGLLQSGFADMGEPRPDVPDMALSDALIAAFAMGSL